MKLAVSRNRPTAGSTTPVIDSSASSAAGTTPEPIVKMVSRAYLEHAHRHGDADIHARHVETVIHGNNDDRRGDNRENRGKKNGRQHVFELAPAQRDGEDRETEGRAMAARLPTR